MLRNWLSAARLRTLPLAFSCILTGSLLAAAAGKFDGKILFWALLTTLFLQVLANFANDFGDSQNGADNHKRIGPKRAVQSGAISPAQMKKAMWLFSFLSFVSGLILIGFAWPNMQAETVWILLGLGIASILAALTYTAGKRPYGYRSWGDLSVLIFFGWVGVCGSYLLFTGEWSIELLLPASSIGLFSVAVLNLNNLRDMESDQSSGKITMVVRLGRTKGRIYHYFLIGSAWFTAFIYTWLHTQSAVNFSYFLLLPLFLLDLQQISKIEDGQGFDPFLKKTAIKTLLFALSFGFSAFAV